MKFAYLTLVFLISLLLVPLALADVTVQDEDLDFEVDYDGLREREDSLTVTHTVTFVNSGNQSEDVSLTVSTNDPDYTIAIVNSDDQAFTLASGANNNVELEIVQTISGADQGAATGVVSILLATTSGQTTTFNLNANITSMIELNEIEFNLNGYSDSKMDDGDANDDSVDLEVIPGDEVEFVFEFENLFDDDYRNGDLDVEVTVELDDSDFGDDIDEDIDFTLDSGEKSSGDDHTIEFDVPTDAEDGDDYELFVTVEAEDENNVKYSFEWTVLLEVQREDDDVRVDDVSVSPTLPSCGDDISIIVEAVNYGSDSQDDAAVTVENSELGIDLESEFSLDDGTSSDNSETLRFSVTLPDDALGGTYELEIRTYYNFNKLSYIERYDLVLDACHTSDSSSSDSSSDSSGSSSDSSSSSGDDVVDLVMVALGDDENASSGSSSSASSGSSGTVSTVEHSYMKDEYIIAMMIITGLAILALLLVVIILALRKK